MLRSLALLALVPALSAPAAAASGELDQVSPLTGTWLYCYEPVNVWQQQVRVGIGGVLDSFQVTVVGPVGAQVHLRLRAGDGWNVGPVEWSTFYTKTVASDEQPVFDVSALGLAFAEGDTFVIEAQGNDTGAEMRGSYKSPVLGAPFYPELLFLSGPGCYDDCGWRMGFQTWMLREAEEDVRLGVPPNPAALLPGVTSGPVLGAVWDPVVDHAAFAPAATLDLLAIGLVPGEIDLPTPYGTLLYDPSVAPVLFFAAPGDPFAVPLPNDPTLLGVQLPTQALSLEGSFALTNALDVTFGSF